METKFVTAASAATRTSLSVAAGPRLRGQGRTTPTQLRFEGELCPRTGIAAFGSAAWFGGTTGSDGMHAVRIQTPGSSVADRARNVIKSDFVKYHTGSPALRPPV